MLVVTLIVVDYSTVRLLVARHKEIIWQGRNMPPFDLSGAVLRVSDERNRAWLRICNEFGGTVAEGFLRMYDDEMRGWVGATEYMPNAKTVKASAVMWSVLLGSMFFIGFLIASLSA